MKDALRNAITFRSGGLNLPNGTRQTYTYDAASRVTAIAYRGPADAVIGDVGYGYDANSRRTSLTDSEGTTSYVYDAVGNRTSMATPSGTTAYTYDAADRLTQAGPTTYSYDANGNLTGRGMDTFGWDSADRLTSATVAGTSASMSYDGSSNLVAKTVGGATTRYVYDRNLPLPQLLTAGDTTYQYGPGMADGFGPIMQEQGGTKSWLHDDALGSIRFTTNASGTSVGSSTYDAFGSQRVTSGQQNLFRFAGQEQHSDIGLIHMRARWYDPAIGRFISRDPIKGSAGSPQSLNPYAYARNNPCNLRDPSGRYAYEAADRLTQAGTTTYSYDANGNLTGRGADTFGWDSADRLTGATVAATTATMAYDSNSNLVSKTVGGNTTRYVYDQNLPLGQVLTAGDTTYVYDALAPPQILNFDRGTRNF